MLTLQINHFNDLDGLLSWKTDLTQSLRSVLKEEVGGMGMCLFISAAMNGNEDIQQGDTKHNDLIFPTGDTRSNGVIQIP